MAKNFMENENPALAFLGVGLEDAEQRTAAKVEQPPRAELEKNSRETRENAPQFAEQAAEPKAEVTAAAMDLKQVRRKKASDKRTERISLVLTPAIYKKVAAEAHKQHKTLNAYLNELIEKNI